MEVADLTQCFGSVLAVDRLSLSIPPGMFYGIVGPNGAGKTTALTAMCGLSRPTAGTVRIAGHDLRTAREAALAQLGVMMDGLSLPERLTAGEVLRYSAGLRGLDGGWRARAGDLLETLGLDAVPRTLIVEYSTGMRKKNNLALALLHQPRVLVLDEPFEAIDPVAAHSIEQVLKQYVHAGGTVVQPIPVTSLCRAARIEEVAKLRRAPALEGWRIRYSLREADPSRWIFSTRRLRAHGSIRNPASTSVLRDRPGGINASLCDARHVRAASRPR
ncbi:ABC transporter ATP-binding protein [Streptomyces sp. NPDC056437]|uniref:ABC transporter ATP-binding protein n=1 Tax=Streptomyces sp. NPDC056437 TaxID=3345816 RepID=UPI003675450E